VALNLGISAGRDWIIYLGTKFSRSTASHSIVRTQALARLPAHAAERRVICWDKPEPVVRTAFC
jgi:hypothetical protein